MDILLSPKYRDVHQTGVTSLKAGDRIDFVVNDTGEAVIRRVSRSAKEIRGMLAHRGRTPVTVEQMDEAVRQRFRNS